jgi:hypothetical protein
MRRNMSNLISAIRNGHDQTPWHPLGLESLWADVQKDARCVQQKRLTMLGAGLPLGQFLDWVVLQPGESHSFSMR